MILITYHNLVYKSLLFLFLNNNDMFSIKTFKALEIEKNPNL